VIEDDPSLILIQGAAVWNEWRIQNSRQLHFEAPTWYDSSSPRGIQVKGRNRLDFSRMNLSGISIYKAFAEGLNLRDSLFEDTQFEEGDFSRADFGGAFFRSTKFNKTIFTGANFDGATFVNCNLNRVNLVEASFRVKEITETVVYGISAWDLVMSDESKQSKLVIEKTYDLYSDLIDQDKIPMMVDDIELAQFVHYLSDHKRMRDTLNILNARGVLLLGRFKDGGLERLYAIREWLQKKGYMAMIFDFARPDNLSLTETVITMAGLAMFVVADLSGPSVGQELSSIFAEMKKPLFAFGAGTTLLADLADKTGVRFIKGDESNPLGSLENSLPQLEKLHAERIMLLAERYHKT
jgi:uncharacterized protein YjbI with pentapeptide repeats